MAGTNRLTRTISLKPKPKATLYIRLTC